jgi:hypothetical protein
MFKDLGRWAPLTGVLFAVLLFVGVIFGPSTPDSDASAQRAVTFYVSHRNGQHVTFYLVAYALVFGIFFAGALSSYLRVRTNGDGVISVGFAGMIVLVGGTATLLGMSFAATDVPAKISPAAEQALNVLQNDVFLGMLIGTCAFLIGYGLAIVRSATAVLPRWLGWIALPLGIVAASPLGWFVLLFAVPIWSVIVSVLMLIRQAAPAPAAAAPVTG